MLRQPDQVRILAKNDAAGYRLDLPGNDVQQGGFAGPVGADHDPQFAIIHDEVEIVERLEAVEVNGHAFQIDD